MGVRACMGMYGLHAIMDVCACVCVCVCARVSIECVQQGHAFKMISPYIPLCQIYELVPWHLEEHSIEARHGSAAHVSGGFYNVEVIPFNIIA